MSVGYTSILWNRQKKIYDRGIAIFVFAFLLLFSTGYVVLFHNATAETIIIRALGLCAFVLLHIILIVGPLARLKPGFLVVLYNRRHLGVTMFLLGAAHGVFSILNFHSAGNVYAVRSVFVSNLQYGSLTDFPFQVLGFLALIIFALMAATSHDFWLKNLGPKVWKTLHMMVYVAYGLIVLHVVLGAAQDDASSILVILVLLGFVGVSGLHIAAGFKEKNLDVEATGDEPFVKACTIWEIPENQAKLLTLSGERVAMYKYDGKISAVNNVCRHQGGPLGEGKIVDGCITCPWHGYQYLPHNGQSPPPFTEKVETYNLELRGDEIWVDPNPLSPGTEVEPIKISGDGK